jgi:hypothetical protein
MPQAIHRLLRNPESFNGKKIRFLKRANYKFKESKKKFADKSQQSLHTYHNTKITNTTMAPTPEVRTTRKEPIKSTLPIQISSRHEQCSYVETAQRTTLPKKY